jgi:uncharacterized membrane protein
MQPTKRGDGGELAGVVQRNIRALVERRRAAESKKPLRHRVSDAISRWAGSMACVLVHALLFGGWISWNLRASPLPKFDPYPFVMLAMFASVEAIFLSTFVLITQNRMSRLSEAQAELDLQINLLAEHEVTRLITLAERIARHIGVPVADDELEQLEQDVEPARVLSEIEEEHAKDDR